MANEVTIHVKAKDEASQTIGMVGARAKTAAGMTVGAFAKVGAGIALAGVGAVKLAHLVGGTAVKAVAFGMKVASANEQAKISFTTMLGSAQKANAFLVKLKDFAAKTPFEFPELQTAASSLISVGVSAKNVIPIMTTLGNVTSGMGTGSEGVKRATIALQQMSSAGRITAEDLNQLRDAGIPVKMAMEAIGAQTGQSTKKLLEMSRTGKLGRKELDALMKSLGSGKGFERFNGLMDKQSHSLAGMLSTLKDTFGQGLAGILKDAFPILKAGLNRLSGAMGAFFSKLGKNKGFKKSIQGLGDDLAEFAGTADEAKSSAENLADAFAHITDSVDNGFKGFNKANNKFAAFVDNQKAMILKWRIGMLKGVLAVYDALGMVDPRMKKHAANIRRMLAETRADAAETANKINRTKMVAKLRADKKDAEAKIRDINKQLTQTHNKKTISKLKADKAQAEAAIRRITGLLNQLDGKKADTWIRTHRVTYYGTKGKPPTNPHGDHKASGGIAHAAEGGMRGNQVLVGEEGPEIVDLPMGSHVNSNADSRRIRSGGRGGGGVHFHFHGPVYGDHNALKRALVNMKRAGDLDLVLR